MNGKEISREVRAEFDQGEDIPSGKREELWQILRASKPLPSPEPINRDPKKLSTR